MHHLPVHETVLLLETDPASGLSEAEAARRLERDGANLLPRFERRGLVWRFLVQFHHPLIYILLAAAAVTLAVGEPVDASVILGVVLLNAVIGFVQESRAERALEALARAVSASTIVLRDGERREVSSAWLVPGDVVFLAPGDKVTADMRLIEVDGLYTDESALTGESVPVAKAQTVLAPETVVADRANMAFSGTLVTGGGGAGVVVSTGAETEIGLIHRLIGEAANVATPLTRKIAHFSKILTVAILGLAALTYIVGLLRGEHPADLLVAAVALAVGAIPEGLPAAVTITLAIGVSRMAGRNAIVRRLSAAEALGSTTVICTDKTGTLTENQMTVTQVVAGGQQFAVSGTGYLPEGELSLEGGAVVRASDHPALSACLIAGVLCSDAQMLERDGRWEVVGDPTEGALLVAARKGGLDAETLIDRHPRVDAIPFESERQFMASAHSGANGSRAGTAYVKGSAERVLDMSARALDADGRETELDRATLLAEAARLGERGLRVLALARGPLADLTLNEDEPPDGLTLLGFQAMLDPPRPEAVSAVRACKQAGVAVKMITGDHPATAVAIAEQIGLDRHRGRADELQVLTGAEIARLDPERLAQAASSATVFARVAPEQKLRLVEALQAQGEIVAMTGDGINDAPALKQADIGVAMGQGGTEVARESADIVLADDNFASIEAAVEEGRRTFDNLTKFIVWTLPTNMGEGLLILAAIVAGVTLPVLPVQVLWINMTTAVALGLMLAFEQKEPGIMERPPRDPARPLLTPELIGRILLVSVLLLVSAFALFEWEQARGAPLAEARTVAINVFVVVELFYLFNCRSLERSMFQLGVFSNRFVVGGVIVTVVLQLALTYTAPMNRLFHTAPLGLDAWLRIVAVGLLAWAVVGTEKWIRRRRRRKKSTAGSW